MSTHDHRKWAMVDFTDPKSDLAGIYTTGLSYCCALSLVKKDAEGNVLKAWLLHLPGGLNEEYFDDLPAELQPENLGTAQFEVIVKFGNDESLPYEHPGYLQSKLDGYKNTLRNKYKVDNSQIRLLFVLLCRIL
jgi:hypothetical protein